MDLDKEKRHIVKRVFILSLCFFLLTPFCFGALCHQSPKKTAKVILSQDPSFSLTRKKLTQAIAFIEKHRLSKHQKDRLFPEETKIPCVIEKCAHLGGYLIRELGGKDHVGRGGQKVVRRAVLYGVFPKIIVDCRGDSVKKEIGVFEKVKGCRGIVPFLGAESEDDNHHSMYLTYFSKGTLERQIKQGKNFSKQQIIKIALDICCGVQALHNNHLIHRDIHNGNILVRLLPNSSAEAVLIDFGLTEHIDDAQKLPPEKTPGRAPPETLLHSSDSIDRYKAEIYALGSSFYRFVFKRPFPWMQLFKNLDPNLSSEEKEALFAHIVSLYNETKEQKLGFLQEGRPLSSFEQLQRAIIQMVHYDPAQRPSIDELVEQLKPLLGAESGSSQPGN